MTDIIIETARQNRRRAEEILRDTDIMDIWKSTGAEPHIVGSLAMGLLMTHRDIDLHIYSSPLTLDRSFAAMSRLAENPSVTKIECRNLTKTEEQCVEWHAWYEDKDRKMWQIDMIHMLKGSRYDGYFERMAERIKAVLTDETRLAILRLKYETPETEHIAGIEYYQAVLRDGVRTMDELTAWRKRHPLDGVAEWMP